ncbi:hypothetical protein BLNAU_20544 [Blattamonas nauphoetae]|uniref:Protein kinase domain-containing protein n=1 Tax=Blattamonas nauphoetae TaxID=2049346 RepID=A0ABQ9WYZ1_9EUKA|nr:hypothetical protein BLNAU_20544 [Blattamonas nauphoetae]
MQTQIQIKRRNEEELRALVIEDSSVSLQTCCFKLAAHDSPILVRSQSEDKTKSTRVILHNCKMTTSGSVLPSFASTTLSKGTNTVELNLVSSTLDSFVMGTGDGVLVSFEDDDEEPESLQRVSCLLSGISVRNGSAPFCPCEKLDWKFSQGLHGCWVEQSSNHLSGALNRDLNFGGSIISSNNTFLSCHTRGPQNTLPNANIVKENINPSQSNHKRIVFTTSEVTESDTIIFTHCHFQDLSTKSNGGAILFDNILSNIHVKHCKFVRVQAGNGGSFVTTGYTDLTARYLKVSDCLFQEGRTTTGSGSSFYDCSAHDLEVSDCLITQCQANYSTVAVKGPRKVSFSNCVLQYNEGGRTGGIRLLLVRNMDFSMNSVIFDDNKGLETHSDKYSQDMDIDSSGFSVMMDKEHVQYCWTTSLRPNCWDYTRKQLIDSKLFGPVLWSIECTGWNEDDVRKGVMDVTGLFWKEEGNYTVVVRDDNNTTFSFEMALGEDHPGINSDIPVGGPDEMKGETLYHLVTIGGSSSSSSKTRTGRNANADEPNEIFDSTTLSVRRDWSYYLYTDDSTADNFVTFAFTTPTQPPHVHSITTSLDESLDSVVFSLITTNVKDGTDTLVLKNGDEEVEMETTIVGSRGSVTELARNLSGLAKVKYGTVYELVSLSNDEESTTPTPISVTTPPAPPRIVSVSETSGSDSIGLQWTSYRLSPSTSYSVFLSSTSTPSGVDAHTRTLEIVTDGSGAVIDSSAQLYPFDAQKQLEYGTVYAVTRVEETLTSTRIASDAMTITTPSEPSRIERVQSIVLNGAKTEATVTFSGRVLETSMGSIRAKKGLSTWTSLSALKLINSERCSAVFSVGLDEDESRMKFQENYSIEAIESAYIVNTDVSITIPAAPVLKTLSTSLDTSTNHHFWLSLEVSDVAVSGVYEASFTGVLTSIEISLTNGQGTSRLEVSLNSRFGFNQSYSLSSLVRRESEKEDEHIVFGEILMKTPEGPTLSNILSPALTPSNLNNVNLKLDCSRMTEESFTLKVFDVSDSGKKEIGLVFSFGSVSPTSIGEGSFVVYGSEELKYGRTYEVISLKSSTISASVSSSTRFTIPPAPCRVESASCDLLDEKKTSGTVTLCGIALPGGSSFSVSIQEWDSKTNQVKGSLLYLEGIVSGSDDQTSASVTELIFGNVGSKLKYGSEYLVSLLSIADTPTIVNPLVLFQVPAEPTRLTKLTLSSYDALEKTANFDVEGRSMPTNKKLTLSLTSSSPSCVRTIVVLFSTSTVGSGSGILFSENSEEIELEYDTTYELTNVVDENNAEILFVGGQTIETDSEPGRVLRVGIVGYSDDMNTTTIPLEGHWMETGDFAMEVENTADSTDKAVLTTSFVSEKAGTSTAWLYPTAELKFGVRYRIVSLEKKVGKSRKVHVESSVEFSIGARPARLTKVTQNQRTDEQKELPLVLTGIGMTKGPFTIELSPAGSLTATFTDGTTGSSTAILFSPNVEVSTLNYSTTYVVIGVTDSSSTPVLFDSGLSFHTGTEPTRLVAISSALRFNPSQTTLLIPVAGRELDAKKEYVVEVKETSSPFPLSNLAMSFSSSEWIVSGTIFGDSIDLLPSHSYSVNGFFVSGSSSPLFFEPISFTVPEPPVISSITASFSTHMNTSVVLSVSGTNLPEDSTYVIHLVSSPLTIPITFTSDTSGSSSPISLIRQPGLPFATTLEVSKICSEEDSTLEIPISSKTFGPFTAPTELSVFSDSTGSTDESLFGGENIPARSLGLLFDVVKELNLKRLTISTVTSTILEKGLEFGAMRMKLSDSVTSHPTIEVKPENGVAWMLRGNGRLELESLTIVGSSELTAKGSGLVWMNGGSIEMTKVILKSIETSSPILELSSLSHSSLSETSFSGGFESVFAKVSDTANMTLSSCTFLGPSTPSSSFSSSHSLTNTEEICSWTGAVIQITNTNLDVTSTKFAHLRQGAIEMIDGRVEIFTSSFQKNFAGFEAFPSFGRNIRCSGNGEVVIESLSGGDGTKEHRNGWIVLEENCTIETDDIEPDSIFFSPALTANEKKAEWNKKTKTYTLGLKGEFLIPCGLSLEVFSIEEKKEKSKLTFPLSSTNTVDWTESSMTLTLSEEKLSQLESKLEWRARLVFGLDDRTSTSVMLKLSSFDERKSQFSEHKNWILPLIISLSVLLVAFFVILLIVFICRRNKKQHAEKLSTQNKELDEAEIVFKMESPDNDDLFGQHSSSANLVKAPDNAFDHAKSIDGLQPLEKGVVPNEFVETRKVIRFGDEHETTIVFTNDTLFNRLHRQQVKLTKDEKQQISVQLAKLAERMRQNFENFTALSRISPHTILLDKENTVMLQTEEKTAGPTQNSTQSFLGLEPLGEGHEGKRWQAPEIYEGKEKVSAEKAAVFSLGLILWELETESVPFGEVDSTNAQRLLGTGFQPCTDRSMGVELMVVIEKCLSLKPDDRPTLQDLISSLESSSLFSDNQTQQNQIELNA